MVSLKPLGGRVLVKRSDAKKTQGGIYLPETAQKKPQVGKVVAVGPGKRDEEGKTVEIGLKTGQEVYFSSYAGNEVKVEGEEGYLILSSEDILCVVE